MSPQTIFLAFDYHHPVEPDDFIAPKSRAVHDPQYGSTS
jgi:hypothetical protein